MSKGIVVKVWNISAGNGKKLLFSTLIYAPLFTLNYGSIV